MKPLIFFHFHCFPTTVTVTRSRLNFIYYYALSVALLYILHCFEMLSTRLRNARFPLQRRIGLEIQQMGSLEWIVDHHVNLSMEQNKGIELPWGWFTAIFWTIFWTFQETPFLGPNRLEKVFAECFSVKKYDSYKWCRYDWYLFYSFY